MKKCHSRENGNPEKYVVYILCLFFLFCFNPWVKGEENAKTDFVWLDSKAGITDEVLAPWTSIEVEKQKDGKGLTVKVWGRSYKFDNSPFPTSIETKGNSILAKPMQVIAKVDGKNVPLEWKPYKIERQTPGIISFTQDGTGEGLNLSATTQIEYDGMIRIDWKIIPEKSLTLEELIFEIQIPVKYAKYIYTSGNYGNKVGFIPKDGLLRKFEPMIWLGNEELGLEWFCESAINWYNVKTTKCIEVSPLRDNSLTGPSADKSSLPLRDLRPEDEVVNLQLHLVDKVIHMEPGEKTKHESGVPVMDPPEKVVELFYTFGVQATPVKPVIKDVWDYRIFHTGPGNSDIPATSGSADKFNIPESTFNTWVKHGVKTISFSESYSDLYACPVTTYDKDLKPIYDNALKKMVKEFHKRGFQIIFYLFPAMSNLEPAWSMFNESFEVIPRDALGTISAPMPPQKVSIVCSRSIWQDYIVDSIDRIMMKEYDLDGVYLDGVSVVAGYGCKNTLHGCGYINSNGKLVGTQPIFPGRELIKRIYTVVKKHKPDGQVNFHNSLNMLAPVLSFATSYWNGEHLGTVYRACGLSPKDPILKKISLDYFRAEFMGVQWGVPAEFLEYTLTPYERGGFALSLLHDVPIRIYWIVSPVWKLFDEFGRKESEWLPYWKNKEYVTVTPDNIDVHVSLYKHPKNGVLAVVCNLSEKEAKVKIKLNLKTLKLKYKVSAYETIVEGLRMDNPIPIIDATFELSLSSYDFKIIWINEKL